MRRRRFGFSYLFPLHFISHFSDSGFQGFSGTEVSNWHGGFGLGRIGIRRGNRRAGWLGAVGRLCVHTYWGIYYSVAFWKKLVEWWKGNGGGMSLEEFWDWDWDGFSLFLSFSPFCISNLQFMAVECKPVS